MTESDDRLEAARFLVSAAGRAAAAAIAATDEDERRLILRLRREHPPAQAALLVEQRRARRSLAGRHPLADLLHLDSKAAAQASSEACALHHAARFPDHAIVADLGCSVGIDSMALAARGPVIAVDLDPARLVMARANLTQVGRDALLVQGRVPEAAPKAAYLFADPDRRVGDRRSRDPELASPSLSSLLALKPAGGLGVKLAPAAELEALEGLGELEFVGVGSELKEILLWTGELARSERRVLLVDRDLEYRGAVEAAPVAAKPGNFLHEPHPALLRSGMLGGFAREQGLALVAKDIAYLTGERPLEHPLVSSFEILAIEAPRPKRIAKAMAGQGIGRVTVSRRGVRTDPGAFERALPRGEGEIGRVFLTRIASGHVAILGRPFER